MNACMNAFKRSPRVVPTCACMHTYIYACIHTYMHAYIQLESPAWHIAYFGHMHTYKSACIHAYMHTCMHAYMHACIHACIQVESTHCPTCTYIRTYIHTYTRTYIQEESTHRADMASCTLQPRKCFEECWSA
jgi:hypothetical protein